MTEAPDEAGFRMLTAKIARERGFACGSYKDRCIRRRIAVRMRARGALTFPEYAALLDSDSAEYDKLLEALTINVTRLFRNPEVFRALEQEVLPGLFSTGRKSVRGWSAGCASGEEAYTLAIQFHRVLASAGSVGQRTATVIGSDIDVPSLAQAERGEYLEGSFMETPADVRERYFSPGWPARVSDDVRGMVKFCQADLFDNPMSGETFDIILCRNVIIYFDKIAQDSLMETFHARLAHGGVLVLGKVETMLGRARDLYVPVNTRERIFRKR